MKTFFSKPENIILTIVAVVAIIIVIFAAIVAMDVFGIGGSATEKEITIAEGDTLTSVSTRLAADGIVSNSLFFRAYVKLFANETKIEFGKCTLSSNMSYKKILDILTDVSTRKEGIIVTVPEGYTMFDIAAAVEKTGLCTAADFVNECRNGDFSSFWFINESKQDPNRYTLVEGYLFPDTYEFHAGTTANEIIKAMLKNFESKFTAEMKSLATSHNLTVDEVIILSSIIQCEVGGITKEEKTVSSVFHNRLNSDYTFLESDPTIFYGNLLKQKNPAVTLDMQKKYSTYVSAGMPVGAISNPGLSSIQAALDPAKTDYYYFVTDKNSVFYYAKTYEEHLKNVAYTKTVK